jgi:transcriptional regulator with XRE-family HTH domain
MTFGERLKELRKQKGITQQELADILKVGRPTVAGYETKGKQPDFEKLAMLCKYFNVSSDELLGRQNIQAIDQSDELTIWIGKLLRPVNDESFQQKFIHMLSRLDEKDWNTIEKMVSYLNEEKARQEA